jgi:hypothetical protein
MSHSTTNTCKSHGWLDHLAIGMAAVCAVHCLLTPILVIALPIIATSLFVHEDFHLWMILLVLPTTSFAVFMGCRKHKDRWVAMLSILGLSVLVGALVHERMHHSAHTAAMEQSHAESCASCSRDLSEEPIPMHAGAWFNTLGGLLLAGAHVRNFRLCRKSRCEHE